MISRSINLYYDDSIWNHYIQIINIGFDGINFAFMPSKPEI